MTMLVPLPLVVPLLVAALFVGASPLLRRSRRARDLLATLTMAATTALAALLIWHSRDAPLVYWFGGWLPRRGEALGIAFQIDPLGAGLTTLAALLSTAALAYAWRYFEEIRGLFHALVLVFTAGMTGFTLTGDLFNFFIFFELMGVAAFGLTCYRREAPTLDGALNFAVTNSIGAFLVLFGIALLYARTGALNLAEIGAVLAERSADGVAGGAAATADAAVSGATGGAMGRVTDVVAVRSGLAADGPDGLVIAATVLLFSGFLIKAAAVPFHFWLPDAHTVAPTPVSVLFSGVMVELGLYAIARIYWTSLSGAIPPEAGLRPILVALGALTAVLGALMCFLQRHLKRLLAFSTISHSGIILIAIGLLTPGGLAGAILYLFAHGLVKAALFLVVGILLHRESTVDEFELFGRGRRLWRIGILFAIGGLALTGAPPFGLFVGKSLLEEAAGEVGYHWIAWVALFASVMTGGAVLRVAGHIFLGLGRPGGLAASAPVEEPAQETHGARGRTPAVMIAPVIALLVIALLLGAAPGAGDYATAVAERFQAREIIVAAVLQGEAPPPLTGTSQDEYAIAPLLFALGGCAGAIILALASLSPRYWNLPRPVVRFIKIGNEGLESLHNGHIGDYVAWITIGVVLLGGLFALVLRP